MDPQSIQIILPVALQEVFDAVAPEFMAATGHHFDVISMLNPEVPGYIDSKKGWSIAFSNPTYIEQVVARHACPGGVQELGYSPLSFAMRGESDGAPIRTVDEIAAFLEHAKTIAITQGGTSTAQFARLLERLELGDALTAKLRPMPGGGPARAVLNAEAEVALLPLSNIASVQGLFARAICPLELGVEVGVAFCVHGSANSATQRFAQWLSDPQRRPRLRELGIET